MVILQQYVADKIALKLVGKGGFVVTDAGFGGDIGTDELIQRYDSSVCNDCGE